MARLSETLPTGWSSRSTGRQSAYFNDLRLQPAKPRQRLAATYARMIAPQVRHAVQGFVSATSDECGADEYPFKLLRTSYAAWARENALPDLSDKVLALALQDLGCVRRTIDGRRSGRGTFVAYKLPEAA